MGILLAALVTFSSAELAARLWRLVPFVRPCRASAVLLVCIVVAVALPHWNPVGQVFLGSYVAAAGTYLALAAYLTAAGGLSPLGRAASVVLFVLEWCITEDSETSLRMLKAGYQGIYVEETLGRGIMPLTFATLKSQRFRWCFGGIQSCASTSGICCRCRRAPATG